MRPTLQRVLACCIFGFALAGCGGGGSSGSTPPALSGTGASGGSPPGAGSTSTSATFPVSSTASTQTLPAASGIAGSLAIPATTDGSSGQVAVQTSSIAPANAPTSATLTQSSSRQIQSGTLTFYFYTSLTFSSKVTFGSLPGFSLTLPSSIPASGGTFFYAIQDPASGSVISFRTEGPATANGQTITFNPSPNPVTFKANQPYVIAFYEITGPPNTNYSLLQNIAIPGVPTPASGAPFSFDISFVDASAGRYYLSDRTTGGIDVVNTKTNTYLGTAKGFAGAVLSNPTTVNNNLAGPNGVVALSSTVVAAGDGDSTLKIVNTASLSIVATVKSATNPFTGTLPAQVAAACVNPSGGVTSNAFRLDEMAYDPTDQLILAINDTDCPPYGTFFSATPPYGVVGSVAFGTSYNGVEQPVWDPNQNLFLVANPQTVANANGEIDTIDPHSHQIVSRFTLPAACTPHGLALGPNDDVVLGCNVANSQIFIMNAKTGAIMGTVPGYGGSDECWYNSGDNRYYCALSSELPGPVIVVVDAGTFKLVATIPTSTQAHSVAADSSSNHLFVPQRASGISIFNY
jgi:hypothetical protein